MAKRKIERRGDDVGRRYQPITIFREAFVKFSSWAKIKIAGSLIISTILFPVGVVAQDKKSIEPPAIPADQFGKLHTLIKPQPGELRFHEIPWFLDVWAARKQAAAIEDSLRVIRLQRNRRIECGERLIGAIEFCEQAGAVIDRIGGLRPELRHFAEELFSAGDIATLVANGCKSLQSVEIGGFGSKDGGIDPGRIRQSSGTAQMQRLFQGTVGHKS